MTRQRIHIQASHGALLEAGHSAPPHPSPGVVQGSTVLRRWLSLRPIDQEMVSGRARAFALSIISGLFEEAYVDARRSRIPNLGMCLPTLEEQERLERPSVATTTATVISSDGDNGLFAEGESEADLHEGDSDTGDAGDESTSEDRMPRNGSIMGRPLKPITRASDRFFDNVTVTLKDWHLPGKHQYKLHFDLKNRTFRVATAATRETWYIVMHPIVTLVLELDGSRRKLLERQVKSSRSSALPIHHAQAMASHIKHVFLSGGLFGERVEASWGLNSTLSQKRCPLMACNKWTTFQERFMESWPEHLARHSYDAFWRENEPVFHAYDYGANIEIEVSEDSDDEADADARADEGSAAGGDESQPRSPGGGGQTEGRQSVGGAQEEWPLDPNSSPDGLYSDGLTQLAMELDQRYELDHISSISYTLAVDLNLDADDPEQKSAGDPAARNILVHPDQPGITSIDFERAGFEDAWASTSQGAQVVQQIVSSGFRVTMTEKESHRNLRLCRNSFGRRAAQQREADAQLREQDAEQLREVEQRLHERDSLGCDTGIISG
ncbi:hypothetical protein V502_04835 [Pseudogymnoascus sp. VKM F-4520 (FW-2644)]|nr:hypothetical protein V502_04835 [Pseudogymnoascus sp. VKM F-4520 (FW-2644)]